MSFIFFFMDVNCWTEVVDHSFTELLLHLCKKSVGHICVDEFLSSLFCCIDLWASLMAQPVKIPPAMQEKEGTPSIFSKKKSCSAILAVFCLWGNHRDPLNFKGRGNIESIFWGHVARVLKSSWDQIYCCGRFWKCIQPQQKIVMVKSLKLTSGSQFFLTPKPWLWSRYSSYFVTENY